MKAEHEITRTRVHGTRVTKPINAQGRIAALRSIVEHKQYAKIDGCGVDLFTASMLVQVYDALNETNRQRFASFTVERMATIGWKLVK